MSRRVFIGPENLLQEPVLTCDADVWRALLRDDDLFVPVTSPVTTWVRNIAAARMWSIEILESVEDQLVRSYPELKPYLRELLAGYQKPAPKDIWLFAGDRLPGLPHESRPSAAHAEAIARWRIAMDLSVAERALLKIASQHFASPELQDTYSFSASADSSHVLDRLAGLADPSFASEWLPEQEPSLADRLAAWTRARIAVSGTAVLTTALTSSASFATKTVIASAYAHAVAGGLEPQAGLLPLLRPYLSGSELQAMLAAARPALPEAPPADTEKLPEWFERSYLPYRTWMHARGIGTETEIELIWSAYEDSYLKALQKGLGSGRGPLAMHHSRALQNGTSRTLLVILDGMLPDDASTLIRKLRQLAPAWTVATSKWLLAAAPTITEICRPSMVRGIAAAQIDDQDGAHTALAKVIGPLQEGQNLVVVKLRQPDQAYETLSTHPESLLKLVQVQLSVIADELSSLMKSVAVDQVVLTADHGRCFGPVEPVVNPCKGKVHRRAIMGVDRTESEIDPRSRRLDGNLLGFDSATDAVVARGATTFVGNGHVWYPHGGLLPEETFVPWLVLVKAAAKVDVQGHVTVFGVAGKEGRASLSIANRSAVSVTLKRLTWEAEGVSVSEETETVQIAPAASVLRELPVERVASRYSEEATILVVTPDGESHSVKLPLRVEIRQMQTQNIDLLDDL